MSLTQRVVAAIGANVLVIYTIVALLNGSVIMIATVAALWIAVFCAVGVWVKRREDERKRFEREWRNK